MRLSSRGPDPPGRVIRFIRTPEGGNSIRPVTVTNAIKIPTKMEIEDGCGNQGAAINPKTIKA
jgi:hypothetical protein